MSSETPAAHLAGLKVTCQQWAIRQTARAASPRCGASIRASTVPELEARLIEAG